MSALVILLAVVLTATMGYAVQRGATCTVAAVGEVLNQRRAHRLMALLEAALWVLGGLLLLQYLQVMPPMPGGYRVTAYTVAGAALLGVGAAVNRACVFGAIARFGSGEWAYLASPVGFYLGSLLAQAPLARFPAQPLQEPSPVWQAPLFVLLLIAVWMAWRVIEVLLSLRARDANDPPWAKALAQKVWSPHHATLVIGVTFLLMFWLMGPWAYTDVLAEWSRGETHNFGTRLLLLLALLGGAALGGWTAGRFKHIAISFGAVTRCLLGGALMGAGSLLIPGSNDGLILTGLPLLWPHAWVAFAVMCTTIGIYLRAEKRLQGSK